MRTTGGHRRATLIALVLAAGGFLSLAAPSSADDEADGVGTNGGPTVPFRGCIYYEHRNFQGARVEIREGTNRNYVGDAWNDRISSIACHVDCEMTAYEHRGYGGASRTFHPNIEYVGTKWNDRISSMKVACSAPRTPPREAIGRGMEDNMDRPGSDYDKFHINDRRPDRCRSECMRQRDRCRAWTYVRPGIQHRLAVCYLKDRVPKPTRNTCCISGTGPQSGPVYVPRPDDIAREPDVIAARRCKSGFVWREARPADFVCVTPESRTLVKQENAVAASRRDPNGAWGPQSCISGFVWREAFDGDTVCVTPERRTAVKEENRVGPSRTAH